MLVGFFRIFSICFQRSHLHSLAFLGSLAQITYYQIFLLDHQSFRWSWMRFTFRILWVSSFTPWNDHITPSLSRKRALFAL
jgi:hypothetical protein